MKIAVLVKQVPDHEALVLARGDGTLEIEDRWATNFFDEIAIEQALRLEAVQGGEVIALSAGAGRNTDALRRALAMGADGAILVSDPALAAADGLGTARALAACLRELGPDLVLCGRVALDDEMGLVGPAVAEILGWPHVAAVTALEVDGKAFRAVRLVEGGRESIEGQLPVLIAAAKGLAEPRVPKVMQVMKASRAAMRTRTLADLGVDPGSVAPLVRTRVFERPPARPPVRMMEGEPGDRVRELASILVSAAGGRR